MMLFSVAMYKLFSKIVIGSYCLDLANQLSHSLFFSVEIYSLLKYHTVKKAVFSGSLFGVNFQRLVRFAPSTLAG